MHLHHRRAQATTLVQVAIALVAITLLTRNEALKWTRMRSREPRSSSERWALMHV